MPMIKSCILLAVAVTAQAAPLTTVSDLVEAVQRAEGGTLELAPGTFRLERPLVLKAGVSLHGAGIGKTLAEFPREALTRKQR